MERDLVGSERVRRTPEPVAVHAGDVPLATLGRVELGEQTFGIVGLAHEVVGLGAPLAHVVLGQAGGRVHLVQRRRHRVEEHLMGDEARVAQAEVVEHDAADVAARDRAVLVAEHVVHERVAVDRVGGDVVEVVGRHARVAVPTEVGRDRPRSRPPPARAMLRHQMRFVSG